MGAGLLDSGTLERCWQTSGDFSEFAESLARSVESGLEVPAWQEAAAFLYNKARPQPSEVSVDTLLEVVQQSPEPAPVRECRYEVFESPICRQKFTRDTVEGQMIAAMSPASTLNGDVSVLSPLDISPSPVVAIRRAIERRPLVTVMPLPPMQAERQVSSDLDRTLSPAHPAGMEPTQLPSRLRSSSKAEHDESGNMQTPSFISESSDQPESRQLRAEAFPTRRFLNHSSSSDDLRAFKENMPMEVLGDKPRVLSPPGSIVVQSPVQLIQEGCNSDGMGPYLRRTSSHKKMHVQHGSHKVPAGVASDRIVGYFPGHMQAGSSVSSPPKGASVVGMPTRLGTGSTPAPLRSSASPRTASPPQRVKFSRSSQPPPQALTSMTTVTGMTTMASMNGAVRSALTPTASGTFRPCSTMGGVKCGSLRNALGGGTGATQYTSVPMLVRQPGNKVVSPRF